MINTDTYKIIVVGDICVGKTSLIRKLTHNIFTQHYKSTIGVDFALKKIYTENCRINLQLWDIAGQERFGNMTRIYYSGSVGAIIVFDLTRHNTFDNITKWKTDIDTKVVLYNDKPIPVILLGNKLDIQSEIFYTDKQMIDYCEENGYLAYFNISVKTGLNIKEAIDYLTIKIRANNKFNTNDNKIHLELTKEKSNNCSC